MDVAKSLWSCCAIKGEKIATYQSLELWTGCLIQYFKRYLYGFFGWDGTQGTKWTPESSTMPPLDSKIYIYDKQEKEDERFVVYKLIQVNMLDPWFGKICGMLSHVYV